MKGSVQKRTGKQGPAYRARVEYPPDPVTGERRQRSKTFRTRREADAALARWLTEIDRGTAVEPSKLTVGDLLSLWLQDEAGPRVKPTTAEDYAATIRVHILPTLGNVLVQRLTVPQVQAFMSGKREAGASPRTVQLCYLRLSQALKYAVASGILERNVCEAIKSPKVVYRRGDPWAVDEGQRFLEAAADDGLSPLWLLALTTGMRKGELLGLRWRDLDWERATVQVHQTVTTYKGAATIQEPKTVTARRTVRLMPEAVASLKEHRKAWATRKLAAGPLWHDTDLITCTAIGTPVHPSNVDRSFQAIIARASLRRIRFHDLRHTHATWLLTSGTPLKVVQERLGHAKPSITLDVYGHLLAGMQDEAVDRLGAMLFQQQAS